MKLSAGSAAILASMRARRPRSRKQIHESGGWRTASLILLAVLTLLPGAALASPRPGIDVLEAQLTQTGTGWVVNAGLDYRFSKPAKRAMDHGVPLTLVIELRVERLRPYWLNETLFSVSRRINISYHPLTQSYHLVYEDTGVTENFAAYTTLLEYLGALRDWQIVTSRKAEKDQQYTASLGVFLDIEALPLPLRPLAYLNPAWHMESHRYLWRVAD